MFVRAQIMKVGQDQSKLAGIGYLAEVIYTNNSIEVVRTGTGYSSYRITDPTLLYEPLSSMLTA